MLKVKSVLKLNQRFFASFEYLGIGKKEIWNQIKL